MWLLARWLDAGDRMHPYLVPFESVAAPDMACQVVAEALRSRVHTAEIHDALMRMYREMGRDDHETV